MPQINRMATPITSIRNLGPAFAAACQQAGIGSAEELRALGADTTYAKLLAHGTKPHFIGYYVLVMGLQGRPWNDCQGKEKIALRARFDGLKSAGVTAVSPAIKMAADLDRIGVRVAPKDLQTTT